MFYVAWLLELLHWLLWPLVDISRWFLLTRAEVRGGVHAADSKMLACLNSTEGGACQGHIHLASLPKRSTTAAITAAGAEERPHTLVFGAQGPGGARLCPAALLLPACCGLVPGAWARQAGQRKSGGSGWRAAAEGAAAGRQQCTQSAAVERFRHDAAAVCAGSGSCIGRCAAAVRACRNVRPNCHVMTA